MNRQQAKDLEKVKINGANLGKIKNQTREMISEALSQDVMNITFVNELAYEIALEAASKQDRQIALESVTHDGHALEFVKNQTLEIAIAAVSQTGYAITHVKLNEILLASHDVTKKIDLHEENKKITNLIICEAKKNMGDDLLNFAISSNLTWIAEPLISQMSDVNHTSEKYLLSPFQIASRNCLVDVMWLLKNKGANIHIKRADSQRNALAITIENVLNYPTKKIIPAVITLLEMGIDPNEEDRYGMTVVMLARSNPEISSIFKAHNLKKLVQATVSASQNTNPRKRQSF
jgi:hypothetical protein